MNLRVCGLTTFLVAVGSFSSSHSSATESAKSREYYYSVQQDGRTRNYRVYVPAKEAKAEGFPVVIYLHGGGGSIKSATQDKMEPMADKLGFILLVPAGTGILPKRLLTWNSGRWVSEQCCGYAANHNVNDVEFISKVIVDIKSKFEVDDRRIFATGISNGGMMAYRLACELSDKIAAVAAVAAPAIPLDCKPRRAISVMHLHGTADPCTPIEGGDGGSCLGPKKRGMSSARVIADTWKKFNSCTEQLEDGYRKGAASCVRSSNCKEKSEVVFCTIEGGGHTWPSGNQYFSARRVGPVSFDISFEQIWQFFERHPREQ